MSDATETVIAAAVDDARMKGAVFGDEQRPDPLQEAVNALDAFVGPRLVATFEILFHRVATLYVDGEALSTTLHARIEQHYATPCLTWSKSRPLPILAATSLHVNFGSSACINVVVVTMHGLRAQRRHTRRSTIFLTSSVVTKSW